MYMRKLKGLKNMTCISQHPCIVGQEITPLAELPHPDVQGVLPTCTPPCVCHAPAGDEEFQQGHDSQEGPNGPNTLDNFG